MQNQQTFFPFINDYASLETISGIRFTRREIDIIACILSGKSVKTAAGLLSIKPKTAETHIRNIMNKVNCNSQESIINFIEKAGKFNHTRQHYLNLQQYFNFQSHLKKISSLFLAHNLKIIIVNDNARKEYEEFAFYLGNHLMLSGIKVTFIDTKKFLRSDCSKNSSQALQAEYIVGFGIFDKTQLTSVSPSSASVKQIVNLASACGVRKIIFINCNPENIPDKPGSGIEQIFFHSDGFDNYYHFFFSLLNALLPAHSIASGKVDFRHYLQAIEKPSETLLTNNLIPDQNVSTTHNRLFQQLSAKTRIKLFAFLVAGSFVFFLL